MKIQEANFENDIVILKQLNNIISLDESMENLKQDLI